MASSPMPVSLFIAELAFADPMLVDRAKVGIFAGSGASAAVGVTLLLLATRRSAEART